MVWQASTIQSVLKMKTESGINNDRVSHANICTAAIYKTTGHGHSDGNLLFSEKKTKQGRPFALRGTSSNAHVSPFTILTAISPVYAVHAK